MRHRCACGLVAVSQLLTSVAALDTFVVQTTGMDSSCSSSGFFSLSVTFEVGFCVHEYTQNRTGWMITANDSHISNVYFQEPGCDGTVAKTEVFEIGACLQLGNGGPMAGTYYKYSVERGESAMGRLYSGANCTGNFKPISAHAAFGHPGPSYSATILDRCMPYRIDHSVLTVCSGSGVLVQKFPSRDCSGTVEAEGEFPIGSCIEGEFLIEAPYCQGTTSPEVAIRSSTSSSPDSSAKRVNVPVSMGYVLLGLVSFLGQAAP